ncbi:TRAP transporter substrate-binding protein [Paracoccus zeaxanthinifaciens]|uniref:TRAP transporter substrate-binding protein n=1 Tax=Paracoccus zeaxanthinifaciens TaxID=187400 RepID=UPI0003B52A09|nr:TRAP transporter substrate-binding protein [Paracoccus zeaxanthinifaciens]
MKRILLGTAIAALATTAAQAETWQMSADAPDGNYLTQNIRAFADDVARLTEGELEIEVVSNSVLLKRPELKRGVQRGIVPIGEVLISALGNEDAAYSADAVPLLATTFDEAKALWDASRPIYEEKLAEEGLVLLYAAPWPPQGIYMNSEVTDASSFDGVKFRAYNPSTARLAELLGAVPATIATAEISQAFSTGVINGMITSPSTGVDSQAWDFVSHYYDVQAFIPKNMVIVNQRSFDGLDEGVQGALREAAERAETRGWEMAETATTEATQTMADNGMQVLPTPEGLATDFEAIAETMRAEWLEQAGEDGQTIVDGLN